MTRSFEIFTKDSAAPQAVKRGFSWPGFFFTWIWAFSRGLLMQGIALFAVSLAGSLIVWWAFNSDPIISTVLSLIVQILVGRNGNAWRCQKLENAGYRCNRTVNASSPEDAIKLHTRGETGAASSGSMLAIPRVFQGVVAIAWLTWKAAFRFRLFLVLTVLLLGAVVGLPWMLQDPRFTAQEFTQVQLTYTLSAVTALLGLATLWLACGTLARDIEECQIQVVATKPIARWQIWLGKWLGLLSLNAVLLAISGMGIYGQLMWQARKLDAKQQAVLRDEVFVARGTVRERSLEAELQAETDRVLKERLEQTTVEKVNVPEVRRQIYERVKAELQVVPPGYPRIWEIDLSGLGNSVRGQPLFLRVKFNSAEKSPTGTFATRWRAGDQEQPGWASNGPLRLAPDTFHEIQISPDLQNSQGILTVAMLNVSETTLMFPLEDGLEVLYRETGFGLNFIRGLGIIFCWMALLATIGLSAASFLSFPVAAFVSLAMLMVVFSSSTLASVVEQGTVMGADEETGQVGSSIVDVVAVPFFGAVLKVVKLAQDFSPVDALSTGRSVTWETLGKAVLQIVLLLGGLFGVFGIWVFSRRELATAQGTQ
jgi:hypothetical protein